MESTRLGRNSWKLVASPWVIFGIAFVIRLWAASQLLPQKAGPFFYQRNEPARIAWALVTGHGYSSPWPSTPLVPTAQQPPGYPLLVAAIFSVFGTYSLASLWAAVVLNAAFAGLTAISILAIGRRNFGVYVGVIAAWVWSCWLYEAAVSIRLWENALSGLLLTSSLLLLPGVAASPRASRWLLFGLLAGVAALTNTALLATFPFFWLWLWLNSDGDVHARSHLLMLSVAMCVLVLVPWTIRNYVAFHRLIPVRDNLGLEFWLGNRVGAPDQAAPDFPLINPAEYNRLGEIKFMEEKRELGVQFVRQHPLQFLTLSLRRVRLFWTEPPRSLWLWISGLAWIGAFVALRYKGTAAVPYFMVLLIFPLVYYVTHTFPTYRYPIEPTMLILASYAVVRLGKAVLGRSVRQSSRLGASGG
jgi:hypothetical protein